MILRTLSRRIATTILASLFILLVLGVALAAAADGSQASLALSPDQTAVALLGALAPLLGYVINHHAPWVSEQVKAVVQVAVAAGAAALYELFVNDGLDLGSYESWQYLLTAVTAALAAHGWLYSKSGINARLGGGSNKQDS